MKGERERGIGRERERQRVGDEKTKTGNCTLVN